MAGQVFSELHEAARAWALAGFYCFPCVPLGKEPATRHGLNDATTDLDQIDKWWAENPSYNIGIVPARSAMFVLDVDPPLGFETLARLEAENGVLPATMTIRTPRGGRHHWFMGECLSTAGTETGGLGPKLDTRGQGGYVLVPPSYVIDPKKGIDGAYDYENDETEIAQGPSWIPARAATKRASHEVSADLNLPANVARAREMLRDYISRGEVATEGEGGDSKTYQVACEVLNLGLTPQTALDVMEDWNAACDPPWQSDELETKIANAAAYAQNDQGAWAVAPAAETFAGMEKFADLTEECIQTSVNKHSKFYPYDLTETEAFQPPAWIIPDLLPERGTVQIAGKHKSFKTFLALDMALGIAAGARTFGHVPEARPVVYAVGENAHALVLNHVPAWCEAREVTGPIPFYVVAAVPQASILGEAQELVKAIRAREIVPGVLVIDTATRALRGLDENSAKDMGLFSAMCEFLQKELACTVVVIRHTGKDESRGGRGSNVIEGDFDTMLHVVRHEKTMTVALSVKEQRNAAEAEVPWTFEGRHVGNSLVFFETDTATYQRTVKGDDIYAAAKIGEALRILKAIGTAASVTTTVLASHIMPQLQDESPEVRTQMVSKAERQLKALSKSRLEAYTDSSGKHLAWYLPEIAEV